MNSHPQPGAPQERRSAGVPAFASRRDPLNAARKAGLS
jgi:hypothetical protein